MREAILALKRPPAETHTEALTSNLNPDLHIVITVQRLTLSELSGARQRFNDLWQKYVTGSPVDSNGDPDLEHPQYVSPEQFPIVDGRLVPLTQSVFDTVSRIDVAQVGEDRLLAEELIILACDDDFWMKLVQIDSDHILPKVITEAQRGNSGAPTSALPSTPDSDTQS